jgi:hypothetical protein
MATPDNARVDQLYQLPLDQFTGARNTLAKELKQPAIKDLEKPSIAAWAVNQLYWQERRTYDRLTATAEQLRAEHRLLLTGKSADIRAAEQTHREAVRAALDTVKRLLQEGGYAATEATLTAVQETIEALPSDDAPGRLVKPLKPRGFEALAGLPQAPGGSRPQAPGGSRPQAPGLRPQGSGARPSQASAASPLKLVKSAIDEKREREDAKRREREERERRERRKEAEKELKAAEATMLRAEEAVKKAEKALGELRAARDEAVSEYQRARLRARE